MSEPGALPAKGVIPLSVPQIAGREWEYVKDCLDTGWVSSVGSYVDRFEESFARTLGAGRAVATVNGTAALHVALLAVGIGPGEEVVVSDLTFIARPTRSATWGPGRSSSTPSPIISRWTRPGWPIF